MEAEISSVQAAMSNNQAPFVSTSHTHNTHHHLPFLVPSNANPINMPPHSTQKPSQSAKSNQHLNQKVSPPPLTLICIINKVQYCFRYGTVEGTALGGGAPWGTKPRKTRDPNK
jgi:hypothetical protein